MAPICFKLSNIWALFFSNTLRLYAFRGLFVTTLLLLACSIGQIEYFDIIIFLVVLVHHLASVKKWRFFYGIIDHLFVGAEITFFALVARLDVIQSWWPELAIIRIGTCISTLVFLSLLSIFRLADLIKTNGKSLLKPIDIFDLGQPTSSRKDTTVKVLFGESIWKRQFTGEIRFVRAIRGILGLALMASLLWFAILNIIFKPVEETAMSPVKLYRSSHPSMDEMGDVDSITWNIVFPFNNTNLEVGVFYSAVTITPIYEDWVDDNLRYGCTIANYTGKLSRRRVLAESFVCPGFQDPDDQDITILPDLAISVNFTLIASSLNISLKSATDLLSTMVIGMTNNTNEVIKGTVPTPIISGTHMIANVVSLLRQIFTQPALASLGFNPDTDTLWTTNTIYFPDPAPPLTGPGISTTRITLLLDYSDTTIIQDYRENSVLAGFSAVGGLWTALSGIFTIIFGASMLRTLYGVKPLSVFGLLHSLQADKMKEACLAEYPDIMKDLRENHTNRGLLALLHDNLLDLNFLDELTTDKIRIEEERRPILDVENPATANEKFDTYNSDNMGDSGSSELQRVPFQTS